jgi:hypothetical protein
MQLWQRIVQLEVKNVQSLEVHMLLLFLMRGKQHIQYESTQQQRCDSTRQRLQLKSSLQTS